MKAQASQEFQVAEVHHGMTLLAFLKHNLSVDVSTKIIKKNIELRNCRVNGRVEFFPSYKVMKGDSIQIHFTVSSLLVEKRCEVVYEDKDLLVINKPAGLVSDAKNISSYLDYKEEILLIHRLDKDTSGLLLIAKHIACFERMKVLFSQKDIQKYYLAIVDGFMPGNKGSIDNYLGKIGGFQGQTIYGSVLEKRGQRAFTLWRSLEKGKDSSLVLLEPRTGRTHQLRAHLKELGHPILGDYQYSTHFRDFRHIPRHMLHAWGLYFIHPFKHLPLILSAPIPQDFQLTAKELKLNCSTYLQPSSFEKKILMKR